MSSQHSLTTTIGGDNSPLNAKATSSTHEQKSYQHSERSKSHKTTTSRSGVSSRCRKKKRKTRNSITFSESPLPDKLYSPSGDKSNHQITRDNKGYEDIQLASKIDDALLPSDHRLIRTEADDSTEIKPDYAYDEDLDKIRADLVQLGIELQENARKQICFMRETEEPDITDPAIDIGT